MKHVNTFEIIPVIELEASDFAENEYAIPSGSYTTSPDDWDIRWKNSLADAGIRDITPVHQGCNFVRISEISSDDLRIIVYNRLNKTAILGMEEIIPFNGGLGIFEITDFLIRPQCCTAIYDYQNWMEVVEKQAMEWNQIWIGHPWIYGRTNHGNLELTEYIELNPDEIEARHIWYSFNRDLFHSKLKMAEVEIAEFKDRIAGILAKSHISEPEHIAETMVYGNAYND